VEYNRLGKSGVKVSRLCMGTMDFGSKIDEASAIKLVKRAVDLGINFFDTADVYNNGKSEEILGKAIRGMRDDLVIATKVRQRMGPGPNDEGLSRKYIMRAAEESLRRLGTDYIDIYFAHRPSNVPWPPTEIAGDPVPLEETLGAFTDLVRSGKVRYLGCSNFPAWLTCRALWVSDRHMLEEFVVTQPPYNLLSREIEREVIPFCTDQGIGIVPYSPLAGGVLTGKYKAGEPAPEGSRGSTNPKWFKGNEFHWEDPDNHRAIEKLQEFSKARGQSMGQVALAWVLANPAISSCIVGAKSEEQLETSVATSQLSLSKSDLEEIDRLVPSGGPYRT
jgi:1-deoxyxylulose-5-phosphate synthase